MVKITIKKLGNISFATAEIISKLGTILMGSFHKSDQFSVKIHLELSYPVAFTV